MTFRSIPFLPEEIDDAAKSGMLVVFVGAGISKMAGCPSWWDFADNVINQLSPKVIDFHEKSLLNSISDPRKRLSIAQILQKESGIKIDFESIFNLKHHRSDIYNYLNKYQCTFVTTNYDKLLVPDISATTSEDEWRFYERMDLLADKLDKKGTVIHLHGCTDKTDSMIITTKDYLKHYSSEEVPFFLESLFDRKTVLFLGYGLEETEVLEYILKSSDQRDEAEKRLFILQGFFDAERTLFEKLEKYYLESFNASLIPFPKDHEDYEQQTLIIKDWSEKLEFNDIARADELEALEDEING